MQRRRLRFEGTADEGKANQASAVTTVCEQRRVLFVEASSATPAGVQALASRDGRVSR